MQRFRENSVERTVWLGLILLIAVYPRAGAEEPKPPEPKPTEPKPGDEDADKRFKRFVKPGPKTPDTETKTPPAEPKKPDVATEPPKPETAKTEPPPAQPSAEFMPPSQREKPEEAEMTDLYGDPPSREGAVGWHTNEVPRSLLNNDMLPIPDRWRMGMPENTLHEKGSLWNPYRQNMLKGDYPILGQNIFMELTGVSDTLLEGHRVPTPSGVSSARPGSFGFFGKGDQLVMQQNLVLSVDLFHGETDFKPRDWDFRITPVFNVNYTDVKETFAVNIDPREGRRRVDTAVAFQELFGEYKIHDLSPNFDFVSARAGIQEFNTDFRGFLFDDNNLGARVFGNLESNRLQYNMAFFEMLNKDTNSGLNTIFDRKREHVALANIIRQDTFISGYNLIGNVAFRYDEPTREYNSNGVIVRPVPVGTLSNPRTVKVGYIGVGGDGHIGRLNITNQFYQEVGYDSASPIAGRPQRVDGRMAALELSMDKDWMRFRTSFFYASGAQNPTGKHASGFDAIFDNPNFAGGEFSYWVRQGLVAGNALIPLKSRFSLIPDLTSGKEEGRPNFVNPGVHIFNVGYDANLNSKIKAVLNLNYIEFDRINAVETLLFQNNMHRSIGFDYSMGVIYRPFLNNQMVVTGGAAALSPLRGFADIYEKRKTLYSVFLGVTLKY